MKTLSIKDIKNNTTKLNEIALENIEKVALKVIDKVEKLPNHTAKTIKNTLEYSEKKQDKFFNTLEKGKEIVTKKFNKTKSFFSKN